MSSQVVMDLLGIACIMSISIGFRARLCATVLVIGLLILNFSINNFWAYSSIMNDFLKYDFFQVSLV